MRLVLSALAGALMLGCAAAAQQSNASDLTFEDFAEFRRQISTQTPPMSVKPEGDNSCQWANDNECDDPDIGTGACEMGTDFSDCIYLRTGEADACQWANDGECDEPILGTGACPSGSDLTDCGAVAHLRFRNDSCETAFNNICEEPENGDGSCAARTDRADCVGRERPLTINSHYQGYDDRIFLDTAEFPWSVVGEISLHTGGGCTATLIAADVLITAAHCVHDEGRLDAHAYFATAGDRTDEKFQAEVVDYFVSPDFDYHRYTGTDDIDGTDWALLRIDRALGAELGHVSVRAIADLGSERDVLATPIYQAGWSGDTAGHLSGHMGCQFETLYRDNTFAHFCDTTQGDSGSPLMVRNEDGSYVVIGVDSAFRDNPGGPIRNIAVRSDAIAPYVGEFIVGNIGSNVDDVSGGKPKSFDDGPAAQD